MKLTTYDQITVFDELKAEWNDLVHRSSSNRIFSTWEWKSTWWESYHPGRLWVITCRDDNDRLVGIAPWFIGESEQGRFVSIIGCKEVTDYLDVIVDSDYIGDVLQCFAVYLREHSDEFDSLSFCNLPEDSVAYQRLPAFLEQCGFAISTSHEDVCPIIDLPSTWEEYLAMLDKKQRHELRRKLRRTQGVNTNVDWYILGQDDDLDAAMEDFLRLMAASDRDKQRFLQDEQNVRFFKAISRVLQPIGWLQLVFLTVDGARAAAYLNFDYNGQILVYNSGLLPGEYGHLSPGIVLLAYNIRYAIENGRTAFDFLQGDEDYKYHMGGKDINVYNLEAALS